MRRIRTATLFAVAALPLVASAADLGKAKAYNAFVFGSATTNGGHSDGAVAVGGAWGGSGYDALQHSNLGATMGAYTNVGLVVGGSVAYSNGGSVNNSGSAHIAGGFSTQNVYNMNGGTMYIGGTKTGSVNGSVITGTNTVPAGFFTDQKAYSLAQSSAIKALGGTAINTTDPNNWSLVANAGQSVFTLDAGKLNGNRTLDVTGLTATSTLIINVTGTDVSGFGITLNSNTGRYNKILWNFADALSINVDNRAFHGTILAPKATVTQSQNIDGGLISNGWIVRNNAELHFGNDTFDGTAPVPEPASMVALGLGVAGLLRRRRKA